MVGTDLLVDDKGTEQQLAGIMEVAARCSLPALKGTNEATKTFRIARATMALDKSMAEPQVMAMIKSLAGSELGFGIDKDIKQYQDSVIRRCAIIALMKGARLTSFEGPEWMVLSGRCYLCKPFYRRVLEDMEGISSVVVRTARHEQTEANTAYVPCTVELRENGKLRRWDFSTKDGQDRRIAVRINAGMIVDAILGKAEAKALRRVYQELSGEDISDEPPEDSQVIEADASATEIDKQAEIESIKRMLDECKTITEVTNTVVACCSHWDSDARAVIEQYADLCRDAIRSERGERSNAQEGGE